MPRYAVLEIIRAVEVILPTRGLSRVSLCSLVTKAGLGYVVGIAAPYG